MLRHVVWLSLRSSGVHGGNFNGGVAQVSNVRKYPHSNAGGTFMLHCQTSFYVKNNSKCLTKLLSKHTVDYY